LGGPGDASCYNASSLWALTSAIPFDNGRRHSLDGSRQRWCSLAIVDADYELVGLCVGAAKWAQNKFKGGNRVSAKHGTWWDMIPRKIFVISKVATCVFDNYPRPICSQASNSHCSHSGLPNKKATEGRCASRPTFDGTMTTLSPDVIECGFGHGVLARASERDLQISPQGLIVDRGMGWQCAAVEPCSSSLGEFSSKHHATSRREVGL
jgi:hypothetical protein